MLPAKCSLLQWGAALLSAPYIMEALGHGAVGGGGTARTVMTPPFTIPFKAETF